MPIFQTRKETANLAPYMTLVPQSSTPANPASGYSRLFLDALNGNKLTRLETGGGTTLIEFSDTKMVPLASITVGVATSVVAFSGIPNSYSHLRLVAQIVAGGSIPVNAASLALTFNADGNPNYDAQYFYINSTTTVNASSNTADIRGRIGAVDVNSAAPATGATPLVIDIPNYAGTTFRKQWLSATNTTASPGNYLFVTGGEWRSTAAITNFYIHHLFGFIEPGSVFTLYALD